MIRIQLYKSGDDFLGFECKGHAGADDGEYDLICNSVSVLTINTANAIPDTETGSQSLIRGFPKREVNERC